jgi:predicted dehydrogenase
VSSSRAGGTGRKEVLAYEDRTEGEEASLHSTGADCTDCMTTFLPPFCALLANISAFFSIIVPAPIGRAGVALELRRERRNAMDSRGRIGIGIVGMGFMGTTHLVASSKLRGGRVVGIVTADPRKARGDFRSVRGNFGKGAARIDMTGITAHPTLESLLEDDSVDLVDVCLPSFLHEAAALQSLKAGRHVLVEKPIALEPTGARRMLAASKKARRLLMVAQVLKFFPEFDLIRKRERDGEWGRLVALHLRRAIARPSWGTESWFADPSKSGGMVIDLHIHDTDFMVHLFGRPRAVRSSALIEKGRIDFLRTTYDYGGTSCLLTAEGSWVNAPSLPFRHGYDAYFEKATCHFDSARSPRPMVHGTKRSAEAPLRAADGFLAELQAATDAVRSGAVPPDLSAELATVSLEVCRAEEKAARTGKAVRLGRDS